jgi:hypothetical protein
MIYSIRGSINTVDGTDILNTINQYEQWKPLVSSVEDSVFMFEAWVLTMMDQETLFNELKPFVDTHTGSIDWHECCHDEPKEMQHPCVIAETYEVR